MRYRLVAILFVIIGVAIGVILSLQVRANPVKSGSSTVNELEIQKNLLTTFSLEQQSLKKELDATGLDEIKGIGVRITLSDNSSVNRVDFSSLNEYFVQATDLRDLVNALFLKDATAVAINGKRILPLTTIQAVFDSILVGNIQISSPFVVEAVGTPAGLQDALQQIQERKIQIFVDPNVNLTIPPLEMANVRAAQYMSLTDTSQ